jgi:hypothetical protein
MVTGALFPSSRISISLRISKVDLNASFWRFPFQQDPLFGSQYQRNMLDVSPMGSHGDSQNFGCVVLKMQVQTACCCDATHQLKMGNWFASPAPTDTHASTPAANAGNASTAPAVSPAPVVSSAPAVTAASPVAPRPTASAPATPTAASVGQAKGDSSPNIWGIWLLRVIYVLLAFGSAVVAVVRVIVNVLVLSPATTSSFTSTDVFPIILLVLNVGVCVFSVILLIYISSTESTVRSICGILIALCVVVEIVAFFVGDEVKGPVAEFYFILQVLGTVLSGLVSLVTLALVFFRNERYEFDVFISYRVNSDKRYANALCSQLREFGLTVFLDDNNLAPGEYWDVGFVTSLYKSKIFVPILSIAGHGRLYAVDNNSDVDNCLLEYMIALYFKKIERLGKIVPIVLDTLAVNNNSSAEQTAQQAANFLGKLYCCCASSEFGSVENVMRDLRSHQGIVCDSRLNGNYPGLTFQPSLPLAQALTLQQCVLLKDACCKVAVALYQFARN